MSWSDVTWALVPVVLILWVVHRVEERAGTPEYSSLKPGAKCWIWLMSLGTAGSARVMAQVEPSLLRAYMLAGSEVAPKAERHVYRVLREYSRANPEFNLDSDELAMSLCEYTSAHPAEALQALQKLWPVEAVDVTANTEAPKTRSQTQTPEQVQVAVLAQGQSEAVARAQEQTAAQAGKMAPLQPCAAPNLEPCAELKPIAVLEDEGAEAGK